MAGGGRRGGKQWQRPQRLLVRAPQWIVILTGSRPQIAEYKPLQVPYWWHIVLVLVPYWWIYYVYWYWYRTGTYRDYRVPLVLALTKLNLQTGTGTY